MPSRSAVLASIALALTLQLPPAAAETDRPGDEARLRSEATALFAAVLPDLDLGRAPCTVAAEWADYPVPAALLDVNAHAELVPPPHETRPAEILDPDGRDTAWFCTRHEVDALVLATAQRLAPEPAGTRAELAGFETDVPDLQRALRPRRHRPRRLADLAVASGGRDGTARRRPGRQRRGPRLRTTG